MGARMSWMCLALLVACDGSLDTTERLTGMSLLDTRADVGIQANSGSGDDLDPVPHDGNTNPDGDLASATGRNDGDPCSNGPLARPIPNCRPVAPPATGDLRANCVARINRFRWECQCLPPLERWIDGESCADSNAQYDSVNGAHTSFYDIPCGSAARAQNECPGWPSTRHIVTGCLQAMWDEGPEDGNLDTTNGHYEAMAKTEYTRVACGFHTTSRGDSWGVQNFD